MDWARGRTWLARVVCAAGAVVVVGNGVTGYAATSVGVQRRLFGSGEAHNRTPADVGLVYDDVTYGPDLTGWYVAANTETPSGTVVLVHGLELRSDSIRHTSNPLVDLAALLHEEGYAVLIPRLGYATGAHRFSAGVLEAQDIDRAAAWAREEVDAPVALWGFSAGAHGVLTAVDEGTEVAAVIADSGFARGTEVVQQQAARFTHVPMQVFGGVGWVMRVLTGHAPADLTSPRDRARPPVLVIHGADDDVISSSNVAVLERSFSADTWVVEGAGHNGAFDVDPEGYAARTIGFLGTALTTR